jgi:hypothetical protein
MDKDGFESVFEKIGPVELPEFSGVRIMMLPVVIGEDASLPDFIAGYKQAFILMCYMAQKHQGEVGYLTVDEKVVQPETTHRRAGAHVDGIYQGRIGGAWGGCGGSWGSTGNGMITVSNPAGCRAWKQRFNGWPGMEGEAEHLRDQFGEGTLFEANMAYWVDGLCVHESLPMKEPTPRQFVRLSLPNNGPWFEGYTENPLGIMPTGPILPEREFMKL